MTLRGRHIKALLYVLLAVTVLGAIENQVQKTAAASEELRYDRGRSAFSILAGEFRAVAANLLWIKADKYHHEYVEKNPDWRKNTDVLPLIRVITALDPTFAEAYLTGAWMLGTGLGKYEQAEAFLREGMRNNPRNWEMHSELALIYAVHLNKPRLALVEARQAMKLADDPFYRRRVARLCRDLEARVRNESP